MIAKRAALALAVVLLTTGMALGQTEWVQHPDNPIVGPGDPGAWDEGGHFVHSVVFDGTTYHMWFTGFGENAALTDIGHATSSDGLEWTMDPANPVLIRGEEGEWDSGSLFSSAVIHDGTQFLMWYSGQLNGVLRTGYATSPDGSAWTKFSGNPVLTNGDSGTWDEVQAAAWAVIRDGDTYRMWYSGANSAPTYRVGYAESSDGTHWTKSAEPVVEPGSYPGAWDPGVGNLSVVFDGATYHMWYTGGLARYSFGYAFSSDGIEWTKHRVNPVLVPDDGNFWNPIVLWDGSTWRMWYSHWDGTVEWISHATSDRGPGEAALDKMSIIPAAAVASGAEGAFFTTDVDLSNAGSQPVEYQLLWLPRGEDNSEPMTSELFSLGAGMSVRYANVLSEVFDLQPDSLGALALLSTSSDLLAMSRIYNTPSGEPSGTYGQAMPTIDSGDFIRYGERKRILFGTENADMRTNVGCQSGVAGNSMVNYELFDLEGNSLETGRMILHGWGNDQINRIFQDFAPVSGYIEVWTLLPTASFYCYGSVLDNLTSDPTTVLPQ